MLTTVFILSDILIYAALVIVGLAVTVMYSWKKKITAILGLELLSATYGNLHDVAKIELS